MLAFASTPAVQAQQLTRTAIDVRVTSPPVPVRALGRQHLVYELHLTNFGGDSLALDRLRVYGAGDPATTLSASGAEEMARRFWVAGRGVRPAPSVAMLAPGARGILYQWIALAPQASAPRALLHDFVVRVGSADRPDTLRTEIPVAAEPPRAVAAPVAPGRWVAVRGPSNGSGHRRALVVLAGKARVPERFAVDWVRLGEDGRFFDGNPRDNPSWFGYDQPVRAVAAGEVVRVRDGLPEHAPLSQDLATVSFTPETVTGNTIVVDVGGGRFAVYAHLRPGSIAVAEGDRVEAGQEIGRIGNSGHSLAPHLHFHMQDTPNPLAGDGLAFALRSFELIGRLDSLPQALNGVPWTPHPARPARTVAREMPLENMVIELR